MFPHNANAQFFKNLGKALKEVVSTSPSNSSTSSSSTTTPDGTKVINNLKGFKVEFLGVLWQKDVCLVGLRLTNTGSKTERIYYFDKMKSFDASGNQYESRSVVGNTTTSLGNGDFDFEPGVPVICSMLYYDMPKAGTKMSLCQLRTQQFANGYYDRFIELRDVVIPPMPVATPTSPFNGQWTLSGKGIEGKLTLDFNGKSIQGQDANSNDILCYGLIYVGYGSDASIQVDESSIISWNGTGNKATIQFVGGRDGNTYEAIMEMNPQTKNISFHNIKVVVEEGMQNGFLSEDLIFKKKP